MFTKQLNSFNSKHQEGTDSCWICAAMMIDNYYRSQDGSSQWNDETALKTALEANPNLAANYYAETGETLDWDAQGSAPSLLLFTGRGSNTDDHSVPDFYEIMQAIYDGIPLLSCVGASSKSNRDPDTAASGHWVVIIGARCENDPGGSPADDSSLGDPAQFELIVADPDGADNQLQIVPYDTILYQRQGVALQYWENTSYVDKDL